MRPAFAHASGLLVLLALAAGAPTAAGQWTVQGTGVLSVMRHRVDAGYGVEPSSGVLAGPEVAATLRDRLTVRLWTRSGSLHADAPGAIDRDVAEAGLQVDVAALRWLTVQAGTTRTYSTVLARQPLLRRLSRSARKSVPGRFTRSLQDARRYQLDHGAPI